MNPYLNELHHRLLEILHRFSHKVFSKDEAIHLVSELILCIPDILFFNDTQVERADLLHAERGLLKKLETQEAHVVEILQDVLIFAHEITHPLITRFEVSSPLVLRLTDHID